jgi:signal transduction histidine kinase
MLKWPQLHLMTSAGGLVREFPPEPLLVRVDIDLMKQAILNLVLNGVQAMTKGGALTLAAQSKDDAVITEVRDQGAGIPPELQEKVFELYFTTKKEGTGIGLAQTSQFWTGTTVPWISNPPLVSAQPSAYDCPWPLSRSGVQKEGSARS